MAGRAAVENAVAGITDKMVAFERGTVNGRYACKTKLLPLTEVANAEKKVPQEWINAEGNGVTHDFIDYALPLIQGEPKLPKEDSLPASQSSKGAGEVRPPRATKNKGTAFDRRFLCIVSVSRSHATHPKCLW